MANHNAPLNLVTKQVEFIKPSKPTPNSPILSLSSLDNIPDNNSICHTVHVYQPTNQNQPKLDPIHVIKEALSKALFYYYPLAGRLIKHADGKFRVKCSDDGVPFLEAFANCTLSSINYLDDSDREIAKHLVFDLPSEDQNGCQYPLVFKVTKFLCGGFTIGMGLSHSVVDGFGGSQFLRAIVELARGNSEPSVKPVWERDRLVGSITKNPLRLVPIDEVSAADSPFLPTKDLVHGCFKVDSESIRRLKMSLMEKCENEIFTSFESLAAYVWRSRARALKQNNNGKVLLISLVGVRKHLLDPPLPEGYYGNAVVDANVVLTVKELNEKPLSEIVKLIRESKKLAFSCDYIKNSINAFETKPDVFNFNLEGSGAITTVTDWKHLGFLESLDFGENELVNALPAPYDMFGSVGICTFSPPSNLDPKMKGGVRIFISLPSDAMLKFKEEMEALSLLNYF